MRWWVLKVGPTDIRVAQQFAAQCASLAAAFVRVARFAALACRFVSRPHTALRSVQRTSPAAHLRPHCRHALFTIETSEAMLLFAPKVFPALVIIFQGRSMTFQDLSKTPLGVS